MYVGILVGLIVWGQALALQAPVITPMQPQGIKFLIPDEHFSLVGLHFSINEIINDVAAGKYNADLHSKEGNNYVYVNNDVTVNPGDTIYYWLLGVDANGGHLLKNQHYVIPAPSTTTTTTTTRATTTTTKSTAAPVVGGSSGSGTQQVVSTAATPSSSHSPSTSSSSSSSSSSQTASNTGSGTMHSGGGSSGGGGAFPQQQSPNQFNTHTGPYSSSQAQCASYPCLIFHDDFNFLNFEVWEHEITASGGGNWEFQYYLNNRSNSYVRDGVLYIKPTLTADRFGGDDFLSHGKLSLWGGFPDDCTNNMDYGCERVGTPDNIINPIQSARLRSLRGFTMKYGKVEVEAKMPKGEWIWPAIWMLPKWNAYGQWPASGEIDIVEARGNENYMAPDGTHKGVDSFGSTLHFGPSFIHKEYDPFDTAHVEKTLAAGTLADDWHRYGVEWDEDAIKFFFDGQQIYEVRPDDGGFWKLGKLDQYNMENPYRYASKMAPFDQEFYLIMNVAVGGTAFFPDNYVSTPHPKPWSDMSQHAAREFYNQKNNWYPTWNPDKNNGEDAAMKVNYIKVWKMHA